MTHTHTHMTRNNIVNVYVDGDWDTSHEDKEGSSPIVVFDKGTWYQVRAENYDKFISRLEYDCYLCVDLYSHPQWDGTIVYKRG